MKPTPTFEEQITCDRCGYVPQAEEDGWEFHWRDRLDEYRRHICDDIRREAWTIATHMFEWKGYIRWECSHCDYLLAVPAGRNFEMSARIARHIMKNGCLPEHLADVKVVA